MSPFYTTAIDLSLWHLAESTAFAIATILLVMAFRLRKGSSRFIFHQIAMAKFLYGPTNRRNHGPSASSQAALCILVKWVAVCPGFQRNRHASAARLLSLTVSCSALQQSHIKGTGNQA